MKKSDINPMPEYFDRYINLVEDVELVQAFENSVKRLNKLDTNLLALLENRRYEPGKWTIGQIFQHLIDFERILSYRALLFARGYPETPQGLDERILASNANAESRTIKELIAELKIVRQATKALYESFDETALLRTGINWKYEISVLAMGFNIIAHQIHHLKIIEEKYFPLLDESGV